MSEIERPQEDALSPGADIWVVAEPERSSWTQKIDWYLNFQIQRSQIRDRPAIGSELRDVLEKWEMDPPVLPEIEGAPLMVSSSDLLPNHAVVMLPLADASVRKWAQLVHRLWRDLDCPRLRVFLPIGIDTASFLASWPGDDEQLDRSVVPETI